MSAAELIAAERQRQIELNDRTEHDDVDDPIRNLVQAGALIAAEIDRLLRLQRKAEQEKGASTDAS